MPRDVGTEVPHLRKIRTGKGLSLRALAARMEPPGSYLAIYRAEHGGKSSPSSIQRWAKALQVTPEDLTGLRVRKQQKRLSGKS